MKMTMAQALDMISRGETPEDYEKRVRRLRRLANERDALRDALGVLGDDPRADAKRKRYEKVEALIEALK